MSAIPGGTFPTNPNTTTHSAFAGNVDQLAAAFLSMSASNNRPGTITKGGLWAKTIGASNIEWYVFDGTNDHLIASWIGGVFALATVAGPTNFLPLTGGDVTGPTTFKGGSANPMVHVQQTGNGAAFRVDDAVGDTTPFIIDRDGKVGIGTDTPATALQVVGVVDAKAFEIANTPDFYISNTLPGSASTGISFDNGDTVSFNRAANTMHFGISGGLNTTLHDSGRWVIGNGPNDAPVGKLTVIGGGPTFNLPAYAYYANNAGATNTGGNPAGYPNASAGVYTDNRCVAAEFDCISDRRMKENIEPISAAWAHSFVDKVQPVSYNLKEGSDKREKYGFIAQDLVRAGFAGMITFNPVAELKEEVDHDGLVSPEGLQMSVNYNEAIPALLAVIKDLKARIEVLEARHG